MIYLLIVLICILFILLLYYLIQVKLNDIKQIGENKELDEIVKTFPNNKEIVTKILSMLGNNKTKMKESEEKDSATIYMVLSDTIHIGGIQNTYTRVQTIAHECLHSIQSKNLLWFHFVFSNIYLIYFLLICVLTIFKVIPNPILQIIILTIFGFIFYVIRSYLETDAMIKAKYLAKEYMEEEKVKKETIERLVKEYEKLNNKAIILTNYTLFRGCFIKIILYSILCFLISIF